MRNVCAVTREEPPQLEKSRTSLKFQQSEANTIINTATTTVHRASKGLSLPIREMKSMECLVTKLLLTSNSEGRSPCTRRTRWTLGRFRGSSSCLLTCPHSEGGQERAGHSSSWRQPPPREKGPLKGDTLLQLPFSWRVSSCNDGHLCSLPQKKRFNKNLRLTRSLKGQRGEGGRRLLETPHL